MIVGFFVQIQIIFLSGLHPLSLIGQIVAIVLLADANHRVRIQISLFNMMKGILFIILWQSFHCKFAFDLHENPPRSYCIDYISFWKMWKVPKRKKTLKIL